MATNYYIDATDLFGTYAITILKCTGLYDAPKMRFDKHTWPNRSGVEIDFERPYYDEHSLTLECLAQAADKGTLATNLDGFFNALKTKGQMVFHSVEPLKYFLVYRDDEVKGTVSRTSSGYAYKFTLKFKVPNFPWVRSYQMYDAGLGYHAVWLAYPKGAGWCFWGDGNKEFLPGPGSYYHAYPQADATYTIFVDVENTPADAFELNTIENLGHFYNDYHLRAIVNKPFTLKFKYMFLDENPTINKIIIELNGSRLLINRVDYDVHTYEHFFSEITEGSFIKIFAETDSGNDVSVSSWWLWSLEMENAGITRFQPGVLAMHYGFANWWSINLKNNAIPTTDIINIFDSLADLNPTPTFDDVIDISGGCEYGENAAPSGRAIAIKAALEALNWTIIDNS